MAGKAADKRTLSAQERRQTVRRLRREGLSFRRIQEQLESLYGIKASLGTIHADFRVARDMGNLKEQAEIADERTLDLERIDDGLHGLYPRVYVGDPASVAQFAGLIKLRSDIIGYKAPVKIAPTTPDGKDSYDPHAGLSDVRRLSDDDLAREIAERRARLAALGAVEEGAAAPDVA